MSLLVRFSDGECRAWFAAVLAIRSFPDPRPQPCVLVFDNPVATRRTSPQSIWRRPRTAEPAYAPY